MDQLKLGELNHADKDELSVGDCGIYSAYVVKVMQGEPYVIGVSGGIGGRFIKNFLDKNRIKTDFLHVNHETKTLMLLNEGDRLTTISSHNEHITQRDFNNIKHKINNHLDDTEIVAISGSDNYLPELLEEIHDMSKDRKKVILGAEGEILPRCIDNYIYAVVLTKEDLQILGLPKPDSEEAYEEIRKFTRSKHIKYMFIHGDDEIFGIAKNKICRIQAVHKHEIYPIVKSTILGGVTIGVKRNYSFEKIMKLISSIAVAASIEEYPFVINRKEIDRGIKHSKVEELYNQRQGYVDE